MTNKTRAAAAAGIATGPIPPGVAEELNRQLNHEWAAAAGYTAIAVWCIDRELTGMAGFFKKQASEEREHAWKIMQFMLDRGTTPRLDQTPAPRSAYETFIDVAQTALAMEQKNTAGINAAYAAALEQVDYPSQIMLQWFIKEQVEEEAWASRLVKLADMCGTGAGLMQLDRHAEKMITGEEHDED